MPYYFGTPCVVPRHQMTSGALQMDMDHVDIDELTLLDLLRIQDEADLGFVKLEPHVHWQLAVEITARRQRVFTLEKTLNSDDHASGWG